MKVKSILILTAAGIMLAACQSNTYHIKGTVKDVQEDTLFLTTDLQQGTPRDTILVKDGQFELSGETDSTYFCMIYSKNEEALNIPLYRACNDEGALVQDSCEGRRRHSHQ